MTAAAPLPPTAFPPFDNSYARDLPGFSVPWRPAAVAAPQLLFLNDPLAAELGVDAAALRSPAGAALFAGNLVPEGAEPVAQAYAGHQFGGFSPQLGDGRALLLGEVIDRRGQRRDIALKGSGRTPFSRGGDGRAAVGPMLREVLIGEGMHALGVPTTRALAVAATGEPVYREDRLPGAVLTRVAASHLRVGTFQYFAARGETERVRQLLDYAVARHDPGLQALPLPERAGRWLEQVAQRQAALLAQWMGLGFIHGVMNTDNMTISGETIDYGPCAFMEAVDVAAVFSSIDHQGRYAYGNQPAIARWNLARLAETVLPLLHDEPDAAVARATEVIDAFPGWYRHEWLAVWRRKLGLQAPFDEAEDGRLAESWLRLLQEHAVDFTLGARALATAAAGDEAPLRALFGASDGGPAGINAWLDQWHRRGTHDAAAMRAANPRIIPRNHRVEEALAAATAGDLAPFEALLAALRRPFDDDPALAPYAEPAPATVTAGYRTFCGT
jgi:serine/tyrosine/threonine adenylyltransferase